MITEARIVATLLRAGLRVWHVVCVVSPGPASSVLPQGPLCPHLPRGNISNIGSSPKETDARYEQPSEIKVPVFSQKGMKLKCFIKL